MTFQVRESLKYEGEARRIRCLPLDPYLRATGKRVPDTAGISSGCWRGYIGTWEVRDDALHLVGLTSSLDDDRPLPLTGVFPGCGDSVEATWFSGRITPDDVINPDDQTAVGMYRLNNWPLQFRWFALLVHRGKLLQEQSIDLQARATATRLTRHVDALFPAAELRFLQAIAANPEDRFAKLLYADWLEEQGDPRCQLLRSEAAHEGPWALQRRTLAEASHRQDIPTGYVDPDDRQWYWRCLAGIPDMTPEDRKYHQLLKRMGLIKQVTDPGAGGG
jgi:uncharacterized protein (TIGR02996 family)